MPTVGEVWRQVLNCPNYEVSNCGRVRAVARRRIHSNSTCKDSRCVVLKPWRAGPKRGEYLYVRLDGRNRRVNVLVVEAFGPPKPDGTECRHIDGDRFNNNASNLCWGTRRENIDDTIRHGRTTKGERHPLGKDHGRDCSVYSPAPS